MPPHASSMFAIPPVDIRGWGLSTSQISSRAHPPMAQPAKKAPLALDVLDHWTVSGLRVEVEVKLSLELDSHVPICSRCQNPPALTNLIKWGAVVPEMLQVFLLSSSRPGASSANIWSHLHLNLPGWFGMMTIHVPGVWSPTQCTSWALSQLQQFKFIDVGGTSRWRWSLHAGHVCSYI